MNKKIIISDPEDEIEHCYETEPHTKSDQLEPSAGAVEQNEGINVDPTYMNGYE